MMKFLLLAILFITLLGNTANLPEETAVAAKPQKGLSKVWQKVKDNSGKIIAGVALAGAAYAVEKKTGHGVCTEKGRENLGGYVEDRFQKPKKLGNDFEYLGGSIGNEVEYQIENGQNWANNKLGKGKIWANKKYADKKNKLEYAIIDNHIKNDTSADSTDKVFGKLYNNTRYYAKNFVDKIDHTVDKVGKYCDDSKNKRRQNSRYDNEKYTLTSNWKAANDKVDQEYAKNAYLRTG